MRLLCSYALARYPGLSLGLKALRTNPAVDWYKHNGFMESRVLDDHFELDLDLSSFRPCERLQVVCDAQPYRCNIDIQLADQSQEKD
jgi:hypothetical protein